MVSGKVGAFCRGGFQRAFSGRQDADCDARMAVANRTNPALKYVLPKFEFSYISRLTIKNERVE